SQMAPSSYNYTSPQDMWYFLIGIPGLEDVHTWISIPICVMYIVALVGNLFLIFLIVTEQRLHEPMYLFLSMLALADVLLATSTAPKMLAIFWFHSTNISFGSCVSQMFFIHFIFVAESAILLAMAFDRYVAICYPLRYTAILTSSAIGKIGIAAVVRSFIVCFPFVFLVHRLSYCGRNIIPHSYCEHMGIARLAYLIKLPCGDTHPNSILGLFVISFTFGLDSLLIVISCMLILHTVLGIASGAGRWRVLNTCVSHTSAVPVYYVPIIILSLIHRFGHHLPLFLQTVMASVYLFFPPVANCIVYSIKTKEILRSIVRHCLKR
ncbi:hypothetical protein M91_02596, partial [Bos mutus]